MKTALALAIISLTSSLKGQTGCSAIQFLQIAQQATWNQSTLTASGLLRQPNGSFNLETYDISLSHPGFLSSTPNYQQNFFNCVGLAGRTRSPGPPHLGTDPLGIGSRNPVVADLTGKGIPSLIGVWQIYAPNLLQVGVINPDLSVGSVTTYPVGLNPYYELTGDFNGDGKHDVAVIYSGPDDQSTPGGISLLLGNGDGTLQTAVNYPLSGYINGGVAWDFNGDGRTDLAISVAGAIQILYGSAGGTLVTGPTYTIPQASALSMAVGDLNGDGIADLVASTFTGPVVLYGMAGGGFQAATAFTAISTFGFIATGDFNKDGKTDVALTDSDSGTVYILLNQGGGVFSPPVGYLAGYAPDSFYVEDFDGDGNPDLVFAAGHPDALTPEQYASDISVLFGNGDGTFVGEASYPVASNTSPGGVSADFNGDGIADIATLSSVLYGKGNGQLQSPTALPLSSGGTTYYPEYLAAGDVNGDKKPDLVFTDSEGGIDVWLNTGSGFAPPASIWSGAQTAAAIALGDFNNDKKLDIAVVFSGTNSIGILLGNGDGTFQAPSMVTVGSTPFALLPADFNGDGNLDLAVVNNGTVEDTSDPGGLSILLGNGQGGFQATSYGAALNPSFISIGDFNGDGKPDLILSAEGMDFLTNFDYTLVEFLNNGNGTFQPGVLIPTEFGPTRVLAADFRGLGRQDLVVLHCCGDTDFTYMLGNGNGSFQPEVVFQAGGSANSGLLADFNGDGKPDVASLNSQGASLGSVSVLLNVTATVSVPALSIAKSHSGSFTQGQQGAAYSITVSNAASAGATTGTVTVTDTVPTGLTLVSMTGTGWSCSGASCTRSDALSGGASYPAIAATVNVAANAAAQVTNQAAVSGGGSAGATASDVTAVNAVVSVPALSVSASQNGGFAAGQQGTYSVTVSNASGAGATSGTVTLTDTPGAGLTLVSMAGTGWTCSGSTCTRSDSLAGGASYPALSVTVNIAANAASPLSDTLNLSGGGSAAAAVTVSTYLTGTGLAFYPVTPCRLADTRNPNGTFGGPILSAGSTRVFPIPTSSCGIPATAQAYSLNITVVPPGPLTYLTAWPTGQAQPYVSTLNSFNGAVAANAAIVPAGSSGAVSIYVSDQTHVVIDINGYFAPQTSAGLAFYPVTPCRIADTRNPNGAFGGPSLTAGATRSFTVPNSSCGIPNTAQAYSLNMTAVPPAALEYLTTWPTGQAQPYVSTLNALQGQIVANAAIVPAGGGGAVSVFVSDASNVLIDIDGYFAPPSAGALYFYPVTPCRIADTRNPTGTFGGPMLGTGATRTFPIPSSSCGLPSTAQAYSLNMTAVPPGQLFYLSTWPAGHAQPVVSTLNDLQGTVVANAAIVPAGSTPAGAISVYVSDPTNLIIDVNGFFAQ